MNKRSNGDGSIYRRKDGRWVGSIHVRTSTGSVERRALYGRGRDEVEQKLAELRRQLAHGAPVPPAGLTVAVYLNEWVEQVAARRVRASTLYNYRLYIKRDIVPALGGKRLEKLTARDVRLFLAQLLDAGAGARTVQYVHSTLRAALEDATRDEVINRNVARLVRAPRPIVEERQPLTVEQARLLLQSAHEHRLYAMFVVFVLLGMRRSEVLGLRWPDVDLDAEALHVRNTLHRQASGLVLLPPKTRRSRRTIPLPAPMVKVLRAHLAIQEQERTKAGADWHETGHVFTTLIGTPLDPRNTTRAFQQQCETAGVPTVPLHALRHTCVSLLLSLGESPRLVMEIVGHSALEMTMNVYGHVDLDSRRDALGRLASLIGE
jgi:integrase